MERQLRRLGCVSPIRVWKNYVLVDWDQYEFCIANNIPLQITYCSFRSLEDATIWICRDQYQRGDISEAMQKYIVGRRLRAERTRRANIATESRALALENARKNGIPVSLVPHISHSDYSLTKVSASLSGEYHVCRQTVRKYAVFSTMIDQLYELEPALTEKVLQGEIFLAHESLEEIVSMNAGDIVRLSKYFLETTNHKPTYVKFKATLEKAKEKPPQAPPPPGSIKEMPQYDPDAEVASLSLTIPSWIGSIQRAQRNSDFTKISPRARGKLIYELNNLIFIIDNTLSDLKEN